MVAPELIPPALVLDPTYPDAVQQSKPWGYWRFETMTDRLIRNEVADGPPLRAVGPVKLAAHRAAIAASSSRAPRRSNT